ncbi:hypothetical protein ABC502_09965 [Alkalimonas sp. NCh-2]|uniref:hypothetical protein n=1 Tax=Alkalimonas sp. NCh-2 TaxID=3144846 RepID=UPI0031F6296B
MIRICFALLVLLVSACAPKDNGGIVLSVSDGEYQALTWSDYYEAGKESFTLELLDLKQGSVWAPGAACGLESDSNDLDGIQVYLFHEMKESSTLKLIVRHIKDGQPKSESLLKNGIELDSRISFDVTWHSGIVDITFDDTTEKIDTDFRNLKPFCSVSSGTAKFVIGN